MSYDVFRSPGSRLQRAAACLGLDRASEIPLRDNGYTRTINFNTHTYVASVVKFKLTPAYSTLILGCTRSPMLGVSQSRGLMLFGREIIFEQFQPMCC